MRKGVSINATSLPGTDGRATPRTSQFLDSKQPMAIQTTVSRARFETNCPEATGAVLSREVTQPPVEGPRIAGIQRAEFTIGVSGCGQRSTLVVVCPDGGEGCFAAGPERR